MIDSAERKLNENGAEWAEISVEGSTYLVFALPYNQLEAPPQGYAFIDSYYVVSNRAYFLRKELVCLFESAGFEAFECKHSYKHIAVASGLGFWLRSTLVANKKFGTRIALEIVGIKGVFAREISTNELYKAEVHDNCKACKICEKLCPQQCLLEHKINYERCTRHLQESCLLSDKKAAEAAGRNLWGCDICQRFCPFNKGLSERKMTDEEVELFKLENLFEAFASGKKGCEPYRDILGGNYLRPSRLLALTLNVMANSDNPEQYLHCAEKVMNHNDERVRIAAKSLKEKCR